MVGAEQVSAYASADFDSAHSAIMAECFARRPTLPDDTLIADLGCGTGDIALRVARHYPRSCVHAFDGSDPMLECARLAVDEAGLGARVELQSAVLPELGDLGEAHLGGYGFIVSNSLLHHLHDPGVMWDAVRRLSGPGGFVFVADLRRPDDEEQARACVARYASDEPEILRRDFYNSLLAAFTVDEVREQLAERDLPLTVEPLGDRHMIVVGRVS